MSLANAEHPAAEAAQAPVEKFGQETLLADFIGRHAPIYLAHYRRTGSQRVPVTAPARETANPAISWHWAAFVLTIPWLFYRKMYLGGIVLVILPVLFDHIVPGSLFFGSGLMIAVCAGLYAKSWYLAHALSKIDRATERYSAMDRRLAYIRRAGGVSKPGAVFGALTQGITISLALRDLLHL